MRDWQLENRLGAEVVVDAVLAAAESGREFDSAFVEEAAALAHDKWLERNGEWAPAHQKLPYGELTGDEQEKDRVFVRRAIEAYNAAKEAEILRLRGDLLG